MEKNKWVINILLIIIMILVVFGCILGYSYFTKDKTKPIINLEQKKEIEYQEKIISEEDYPRVDGSIVTLPLNEAFKANFTATNIEETEIIHSNTNDAYLNLINGDTDLIIITEPTEEMLNLAEKKNVELEIVPIVKDAFVFFVNEENPIDNLTLEQIQNIYSGKTRKWSDIGGENKKIIAYQRPNNSESQKGMLNLVMKSNKIMNPPTETVKQDVIDIVDVIADYDNDTNAIGYSYYNYTIKLYETNPMKLLSINGIKPNYENIQTGLYNLQATYYAIIRKDETEDSNTRKILETMKSDRGQNVAKEAGYVQNY